MPIAGVYCDGSADRVLVGIGFVDIDSTSVEIGIGYRGGRIGASSIANRRCVGDHVAGSRLHLALLMRILRVD